MVSVHNCPEDGVSPPFSYLLALSILFVCVSSAVFPSLRRDGVNVLLRTEQSPLTGELLEQLCLCSPCKSFGKKGLLLKAESNSCLGAYIAGRQFLFVCLFYTAFTNLSMGLQPTARP